MEFAKFSFLESNQHYQNIKYNLNSAIFKKLLTILTHSKIFLFL